MVRSDTTHHSRLATNHFFALLKRFNFFLFAFLIACQVLPACRVPEKDPATREYLKQYANQKKPLAVDFYAPAGQVSVYENKITVHFTQPMVPLSALGRENGREVVRIDPRPPGYFKWVNTRTLVYQVKGRLPYATTFQVTVRAGEQSLLGFALLKNFTYTFETPEPRVKSVLPRTGAQNLSLKEPIRIEFNQPVDPDTVRQFVRLKVRGTEDFPVNVGCFQKKKAKPAPPPCRHVVVTPVRPLPKDASVTFKLLKGLKGVEGDRVLNEELTYFYKTYGPFQIERIRCFKDKCPPDPTLQIFSSTPISAKDFHKYVHFQPQVKNPEDFHGYWVRSKGYFAYYPRLKPNREYIVTLRPGLKDAFGQKLTQPVSFRFKTLHEEARFDFPYVETQVVPYHNALDLGFVGTNILSADAAFKLGMSDQEIIAFLKNPVQTLKQIQNEKSWDLIKTLTGEITDQRRVYSIPVTEVLGSRRAAIVLANHTSAQVTTYDSKSKTYRIRNNWFIRQITDLAIDVKLSSKDGLVWVTRLTTGESLAGVRVRVYNNDGDLLHEAVTGEDGTVRIPGREALLSVSKGKAKDKKTSEHFPLYFFAQTQRDRSFLTTEWADGLGYYGDYGLYEEPDEHEEKQYLSDTNAYGIKKIRLKPSEPVYVRAHVLTDRGLYQPGETVHIKGYVREVTPDGLKPFAGDLVLNIREPLSDKPVKKKIKLNERGNFTLSYEIGQDSPLGHYDVALKASQRWIKFRSGFTSFQVEKFRTPEFKVAIDLPKGDTVRGDTLTASVKASYLFGAPLKEAPLKYYVNEELTAFKPHNDRGWQFGRLYEHRQKDEERLRGIVKEEETKTSQDGTDTINIKSRTDIPDPVRYFFEVVVSDLSGQSQAGFASRVVHPASFYIGAKSDKLFFETGESLPIAFATLAPDGSYVFGKNVTVDLMRVKWVSIKRKTLNDRFESEIKREEEKIDTCAKKTKAKENTCTFTVSESGYYYFKLTARDAAGREALTEVPVYVSGASYAFWPSEDSNWVALVADKERYRDGETAKILIKSPYNRAHALISLERDGILSYEVKKLEGSTPLVTVPIREAYAPNVFVKVVLVKGALDVDPTQEAVKERMAEALVKAGQVALKVVPRDKKLALQAAPAQNVYRPGETAEVSFTVNDLPPGEEAEITVMVVDEGVLLAGGYRLKDPLDTLYAPYEPRVAQMDSRTHYVGLQGLALKMAKPASGGGRMPRVRGVAGPPGSEPASGGSRMPGFRQKFIPLAFFKGDIETKEGKATVSFKIPDQLTTFKVMAIANAASDRFGLATAEFKTQKDVMIRPALPGFLRVGDRFSSNVVIHNNTDEKRDLAVSVTAKNLVVTEGASGKISVPARSRVSYPVSFKTDVAALVALINQSPAADREKRRVMAAVTFEATGDKATDKVVVRVPVFLDRAEETVATSGVSAATVSEFLEKTGSMDEKTGGLDITLSANLLARLKETIARLRRYPYDCLEQRLAKMYPYVLFPHRNDFFTGEERDVTRRFNLVEGFIRQLKRSQFYSGEFGFWPASTEGDPALTLMVAEFLATARESGHDVEAPLGKIRKRLFDYLQGTSRKLKSYPSAYRQALKVHALYVLFRLGEAQPSYYSDLKGIYENLDAISQGRLVEMVFAEDPKDALVTLWLDGIKNRLRIKGEAAYVPRVTGSYYFGQTDKTTTAQVLQTLLRVDPGHPFVFALLKYLVDDRRAGRYVSSLEAISVLKAMRVYQKVFPGSEKPVTAKLILNDRELIESRLSLRRPEDHVSLPMEKLPDRMLFQIRKKAGEVVFYDITYRYALKEFRPYGLEEGITYTREFFDLDGNRVKPDELKHGRTYRVVLNFYFADRADYLVVEEPVAAGLEPVNFSLRTVQRSLKRFAKDLGSRFGWYLTHREFHQKKILLFADRVPRGFFDFSYFVHVTNAGSFIVPPGKAMEMYHPEVFGTTGAGHVVSE